MKRSKSTSKSLLLPTATLALVVALGTALGLHYGADPRHAELEARAKKVFTHELARQNKIPAHLMRSLSLALEFHDDDGADALLSRLERSLN